MLLHKLDQLSRLSDKELVDELKAKGLDSFGTRQERFERLRRHLGLPAASEVEDGLRLKPDTKSSCVKKVEKMKEKRDERRVRDSQRRQDLLHLKTSQEAQGCFGRPG